ncbi:MAG: glutamate racemase [Verrucomicrobiota bacterium]|nr:glutamate racemase [Chthoniobacterales bacterium]MDQ3413440.1 glutamate racemase [Verrucomicrobiota bacterium]
MAAQSALREKPIGVFDSGIGGLTVVRALRELLPNESIFYLGDTARVPYGGKSAPTVERYSLEITAMLLAEDCKTVVVACNTASALALPQLEATTPVPITGVIRPGAQAAVGATRNGHIGVIGTRATIKSGAYERALLALDPAVRISARACPLFVPLIEEGWLQGEITDQIVRQYLAPLVADGVDTLVLGCTHYPLLREAIGQFLGDTVRLVDSAQNCATAVAHLLEKKDLRADPGSSGQLAVALTDPPDAFLDVALKALQLEIGEVQLREVIHLTR